MKNLKFILILISATVFFDARSQELPRSMAALGDSITAGALADFNRTDAASPIILPKFLYFVMKFGFMHSIHAFESPALDWATGWEAVTESQAYRLQQLADGEGWKLQSLDAAISGDTSYQLAKQVTKVLDWSDQKLRTQAPDYVVVDIGANDACSDTNAEMTPAADYGQNVRNVAETFLKANPNSHILFGGIPNLEHLREVAENARYSWLPTLQRCSDFWHLVGYCKNVLEEKDPAKRQEVTDRLLAYMHEIETMRDDMNATYGDDRVRFADDVYTYDFTADEISIDCFHPNKEGQHALAALTWQKSWWAD